MRQAASRICSSICHSGGACSISASRAASGPSVAAGIVSEMVPDPSVAESAGAGVDGLTRAVKGWRRMLRCGRLGDHNGAEPQATTPMQETYDFAAVEAAAQKFWNDTRAFEVKEDASKPK